MASLGFASVLNALPKSRLRLKKSKQATERKQQVESLDKSPTDEDQDLVGLLIPCETPPRNFSMRDGNPLLKSIDQLFAACEEKSCERDCSLSDLLGPLLKESDADSTLSALQLGRPPEKVKPASAYVQPPSFEDESDNDLPTPQALELPVLESFSRFDWRKSRYANPLERLAKMPNAFKKVAGLDLFLGPGAKTDSEDKDRLDQHYALKHFCEQLEEEKRGFALDLNVPIHFPEEVDTQSDPPEPSEDLELHAPVRCWLFHRKELVTPLPDSVLESLRLGVKHPIEDELGISLAEKEVERPSAAFLRQALLDAIGDTGEPPVS
uniref:Uncharacterized protein n=1 Tax=Chromera velia CCMP2878 TaxID=1169474 RepID=A0A0G4HZ11_9ALVE|eukprot:Cvel_1551.t1-p1 / transcript=Cvel_1551.t1 / gene=Cvel_1551 / organism=Chromera_velia_CCMP2878 / gene_product=hypothetical protein / transcript_product=hypothetical protein / location=Cvel_scaffold55:40491-41459(+) / protein_length=323 / sequence_SO=supercontig / SO=protein_coding / is_pseudo=false